MKAPFGMGTGSDVWLTAALAIVGVVGTVVEAAIRVAEVIPNRDVPVELQVPESTQQIAIEGVGDAVPVGIDRVTVRVPELSTTSHLALIAGIVVPAVATVVVLLCVAWLLRNIGTGQFFNPTNTRLVTTVAITVLLGWILTGAARTGAMNGAYHELSDRSGGFEITMGIAFEYLFAAMVAGCIAAVFHSGERMRRDTEGLV